MELYATGARKSKQNPNMLRFYFNGFFKKDSVANIENLRIRISQNEEQKDIPIQVKRGYSSFVDVVMEPQGQPKK